MCSSEATDVVAVGGVVVSDVDIQRLKMILLMDYLFLTNYGMFLLSVCKLDLTPSRVLVHYSLFNSHCSSCTKL